MSSIGFAILILSMSVVALLMGYNIPRGRVILVSIGFYVLISGVYATYSNWLPQVRGEVPEEAKPIAAGDIENMPPDKLAEIGEVIIFGKLVGGNPVESDVGRGQCPLCHRVTGTNIRDRAPDMTAAWAASDDTNKLPIAKRAILRTKDPRYLKPDSVQTEAHPGSGRATTAAEYIAESHACPNCFVVEGFGTKGTNDRESPMPVIHKPPIGLTIEDLIAVDTFLFVKDGLAPPPVREIRAAYMKFIPEKDRPATGAPAATQVAVPPGGLDPAKMALPGDMPEQIVMKMQCFICHQIPTIAVAKFGVIGPLLIEGHNAPRRLASPKFKADFKAGRTKAKTPKEYVMESIMKPNAHISAAFVQANNPEVSPMLQDFATKFTFTALEKMADFLLTLDCDVARKDGLKGPPQEPIEKVCGPATQAAETTVPVKTTEQHARAGMLEEVR